MDKSQNPEGLYKVNIVNQQETFVTLTKRNKHQRLVVLLILKEYTSKRIDLAPENNPTATKK